MGEEIPFTYIETPKELAQAEKEWKGCKEFGIDIECENNLHHYGTYISIIQISNKEKNWIVDVLALDDISPVLKMFEDGSVLKIFHDVNFDFRIIKEEFGIVPKNIFDSEKAAVYLGKEKVGLGSLLEEYFGLKKQSRYQMADWTRRPLKKGMLAYAILDTAYLIKLKDQLTKELKQSKKLSWALEAFKAIETSEFKTSKPTFKDFRGFAHLTPQQQSILKNYYSLREKLAKKVDMPTHFIIGNKKLKELVLQPPRSIGEWKNVKSVHPIVRSFAESFHKAVLEGKKNPLYFERKKAKRFNESQKNITLN